MNKMEPYQGHANWYTWNLSLWAANEESAYFSVKKDRPYTEETAEDKALELFPNGTPDMKSAADLGRVNYKDIAGQWNDEDF